MNVINDFNKFRGVWYVNNDEYRVFIDYMGGVQNPAEIWITNFNNGCQASCGVWGNKIWTNYIDCSGNPINSSDTGILISNKTIQWKNNVYKKSNWKGIWQDTYQWNEESLIEESDSGVIYIHNFFNSGKTYKGILTENDECVMISDTVFTPDCPIIINKGVLYGGFGSICWNCTFIFNGQPNYTGNVIFERNNYFFQNKKSRKTRLFLF